MVRSCQSSFNYEDAADKMRDHVLDIMAAVSSVEELGCLWASGTFRADCGLVGCQQSSISAVGLHAYKLRLQSFASLQQLHIPRNSVMS